MHQQYHDLCCYRGEIGSSDSRVDDDVVDSLHNELVYYDSLYHCPHEDCVCDYNPFYRRYYHSLGTLKYHCATAHGWDEREISKRNASFHQTQQHRINELKYELEQAAQLKNELEQALEQARQDNYDLEQALEQARRDPDSDDSESQVQPTLQMIKAAISRVPITAPVSPDTITAPVSPDTAIETDSNASSPRVTLEELSRDLQFGSVARSRSPVTPAPVPSVPAPIPPPATVQRRARKNQLQQLHEFNANVNF